MIEGSAGAAADPRRSIAAFLTALGEVDAPAELRAELRLSTVEPAVTTAEATTAERQAERITAPIVLVVGTDRLTIDRRGAPHVGDLRDGGRRHVWPDPRSRRR